MTVREEYEQQFDSAKPSRFWIVIFKIYLWVFFLPFMFMMWIINKLP